MGLAVRPDPVSHEAEALKLAVGVQHALASALHTHGQGALLTKFLAVVETIESDGTRALWLLPSPGMMQWDSIGLIEYARRVEMRRVD
jgi:hypothetical protein